MKRFYKPSDWRRACCHFTLIKTGRCSTFPLFFLFTSFIFHFFLLLLLILLLFKLPPFSYLPLLCFFTFVFWLLQFSTLQQLLFFFLSFSILFSLTFFLEFFLLFLQFCLFIFLPVFHHLSLIPLLSSICSPSAPLSPVPPLSPVLSPSPVLLFVFIVPDHLLVHQLWFSPSFMLPPALLTATPKPCWFSSCASSTGIFFNSLLFLHLFLFRVLHDRQSEYLGWESVNPLEF